MKRILFSVGLLLFISNIIFSQTVNTIEPLCDTCNKELYMRFESTSFLKNNEYFNSFTKGFTGIGFIAKPTFEYYLSNKTKINAGLYLLKYSGRNKFKYISPIFSVEYQINKKIRLIIGSIYGKLNHQLEEPLYRYDRSYQDNTENGVQLLWKTSRVQSDLWMNWKKFILRNDPFQEEITGGNTTIFNILTSNKLNISVPFQFLVFHKGGQIDSSPDPVASILNGSTGFKFYYKVNNNTFGFEPSVFFYQGWGLPDSGVNSQLYNKGSALYIKTVYNHKQFYSMLGFWSADKFIAPNGEYLFQSVSELNNTFSEDKRQLITAKIGFKKKISSSFNIELRADGYYDIINRDFSHSVGLYLSVNEAFFLKRIKTKNEILKE